MNFAPALVDQARNDRGSTAAVGTRVESWFTPSRFALLLGLLIAAFFAPVLIGGETFFYRDYGAFSYPLAKYHRDCFWRGELPLWNSLSACGIPYLAQWSTMTLYPLSLIYLLLPMPWSLSFFCLAHLFLGGMGMYLLAHFWTQDRLAAAVAGIAFSFNGLALNCLMWPCNIAGLGWMPWVVLAAQKAAKEGGRAVINAAFIGAIQMFTGAPEIIFCTWIMNGVLFASQIILREISWRQVFTRGAVIVLLVTGLAAAQLWPFLDLVAHSERDSRLGGAEWAMPPWGWINLVLPLFRTHRAAAGVCFQPDQQWTSSYYPGIGVLLLSLLALRPNSGKRVWLLWSVAAFGLIMALGESGGLYFLIRKLAAFIGLMRYPVKFVILTIFVLPLLAATTVAELKTSEAVAVERVKRRAVWMCGVIIALVLAAILFSYSHPYRNLRWSDLLQNGILRLLFLLLVAGVLFRFAATTDQRTRFWLQNALLFCLAIDAWTHLPNQNPTIPASIYGSTVGTSQLSQACVSGQSRAFVSKSTAGLLLHRTLADPVQDFLGRRAGLFGDCNLLDNVPTVDGFYSLSLFEQRQIWSKLYFTPVADLPAGLADFVGVSQLATNLFEWQARPSAQPVVTMGARPEFVERDQTLNRLGDPAFDPRQIVYLPLEAKGIVSVSKSVAASRIQKTTFASGRITAECEASEPALLVVAESYYEGWQAKIDSKPAKIWRANHAFQAVEVPAGRHRIEFAYKEKHLLSGSLLSGATLLGCLSTWFRRRTAKAPDFRVLG